MTDNSNVQVDDRGFVCINGVKVAKYLAERHCLQFVDRDRWRSKKRGTQLIEVPVDVLNKLGDNDKGQNNDG